MNDNDTATLITADGANNKLLSQSITGAYFAVANGQGTAFTPEELQLGTEQIVIDFVIGLLTGVILMALLACVVMRFLRGNVCKQTTAKEEDKEEEDKEEEKEEVKEEEGDRGWYHQDGKLEDEENRGNETVIIPSC